MDEVKPVVPVAPAKPLEEAKLGGAPLVDDDVLDLKEVAIHKPAVKKLLRSARPESCAIGVFCYVDERGGYSYSNTKGERCYTTGELRED